MTIRDETMHPVYKAFYTVTLPDGSKLRQSMKTYHLSVTTFYQTLTRLGYTDVRIFPVQTFQLN
jgi:hypothetical protein